LEYRLKKQSDFDLLFRKGKKSFSNSMMMLYISSSSLKVGYSLSKKHGKAVTRNRIKRQLRAAFRTIKPQVKCNYHIVFLPKVMNDYSYKVFLRDMKYLLSKEKLTNGQ